MNIKNQSNTPSITISKTRANKARTKLLLIAQGEVISFKNNATKINSKSIKDLISEYESIEIVILNPIEMGTSNQKMSYDNNDFIFNQSCSIVELNINEEIIRFVQNLNRTLFSERKLLKWRKNDQEDNENESKKGSDTRQMSRKRRNKIAKKEKISLIKDSCHYLRKLCFNYIKKKRNKNRKELTYQPKTNLNIFRRMNSTTIDEGTSEKINKLAQKFALKEINNDNTNSNTEGDNNNFIQIKTQISNSSQSLPTEKDKTRKRVNNTSNDNQNFNYLRRNSQELSYHRSAFGQMNGDKLTRTTQFNKAQIEIIEDDNDNEDTIDDYNQLKQIKCSNVNTKQNTNKVDSNRKLSGKDPVLSMPFPKGIFNES